MSLLKRLTLSPKKLEANQANARLSQGPATAEGIERIRDAHLQHGFYSKSAGEAMRALGERPDDFERLVASLTETWQPESDYELALVRRLARALWRVERADRIQEAMTVNQAERVAMHVEELAEKDAASHKEKTAVLERLLQQSQHIGFYTSVADLRDLEAASGRQPKGRQGQILYLAWRLMRPSDPATAALAGQVAKLDVELSTVSAGHPVPAHDRSLDLGPATGGERDRLRAELRWLLRQEIEAEQNSYRQQRDRRAREMTSAALDAAMAPDDPHANLMLRAETAAFRQVREITEMLIKFRQLRSPEKRPLGRPRRDPEPEKLRKNNSEAENEGKSHDVIENKGPAPGDVG